MRYCHLEQAKASDHGAPQSFIGSTDPVKGGSPATELIENDKTPGCTLFQYQASLDHLHHEC